jgi:hypothetical protein
VLSTDALLLTAFLTPRSFCSAAFKLLAAALKMLRMAAARGLNSNCPAQAIVG